MNEQLIVKNFGPIKDATVDFKRVTVFIGPTGGGKSTLAKLAAIFKDKTSFTYGEQGMNNLVSGHKLKNYFNTDTFIEWTIFPARMLFDKGKWKQAFHKTIKDERTEIKRLIAELKADISALNNIIDEGEAEATSKVTEVYEKQARVNKFIKDYAAPFKPSYIPSERIILSTLGNIWPDLLVNKIAISSSLSSFARGYLNAREIINTLPIKVFDVEYLFENEEDKIVLNTGKSINISDAASGIQSVIPLLVLLEHLSRNTEQAQSFIIEEPELNLYPTAQQGLLNWLVEKCTKGEDDLTITTHSPYLLAHFNTLLFAYQVAQNHPERTDEIAKIVPRKSWINPAEFAAYHVEGQQENGVRSIVNSETGLISYNGLDAIASAEATEFEKLLDINAGLTVEW